MQVKVRVIPNATRSEIVGWMDDALKVKVQSVAEGGRANKALCELLAGTAGIRARQVIIQSGQKSRVKLVELPIEGDPRTIFT